MQNRQVNFQVALTGNPKGKLFIKKIFHFYKKNIYWMKSIGSLKSLATLKAD